MTITPAQITGLTATPVGSTSVLLTWNAAADPTPNIWAEYVVYQLNPTVLPSVHTPADPASSGTLTGYTAIAGALTRASPSYVALPGAFTYVVTQIQIEQGTGTVFESVSSAPVTVVYAPAPPGPQQIAPRTIGTVRMNLTAPSSIRHFVPVAMNLASPPPVPVISSGGEGLPGQTYRYRMYLLDGTATHPPTEITQAFERTQGTIEVNNDRDVVRTGTFVMYPQNASAVVPFVLAPNTPFIVVREVLQSDLTWRAYPRGVFLPTHIELIDLPNGYEYWQLEASDPSIQLTRTTTVPFLVPAGSNPLALAAAIVQARGLKVSTSWPANLTTILNFDHTFQPNTSWLTIVNWLLNGANCYNVAVDNSGFAVTRQKVLWYNETPSTTYSTVDQAFNNILPPFRNVQEATRYANQVGVAIDDQLRQDAGSADLWQNNDPISLISVQMLATQYDEGIYEMLDGNGTPDFPRGEFNAFADGMAQLRLIENASRAYGAVTLNTLVDPRRDVLCATLPDGAFDGFYSVTIDAVVPAPGQLYRVAGWKESFTPDQPMVHTLNKVTPSITLTPPLLVGPTESGPVTAGVAFQLGVAALNSWQASGVDPGINTSYTQTVIFTSTDPLAILPAPYTFTLGDAGQKTDFSVQLKTPGYQTITVQAVAGGDTTRGTSGPIQVQSP